MHLRSPATRSAASSSSNALSITLNESKTYAMSYPTNNLPTSNDEWDVLWTQLQDENDLKTDRECLTFLTQMVMGITSTMSEIGADDPNYESWQLFVHLVFDEWQVYDNLLNQFND